MGFRPPETIAHITGEDEYEGFEADVSLSMPLRQALGFSANLQSGDSERIRETLYEFGERVLRTWNVEDDAGQSVPASGDGLLSQDMDLALALVRGWNEALVAPPLPSSGPPAPGPGLAQDGSPRSSTSTTSSTGSASDMEPVPV